MPHDRDIFRSIFSIALFRILLILSIVFCVHSYLLGQQHSIGGSIGLHVPILIDQIDMTTPALGMGGNLHFLYEYQYKYLLIDAGLGMGYEQANQKITSENLSVEMVDTRGNHFTYKCSIQNRQEAIRTLSLQIPVHIGVEVKRFYMLMGVTFTLPLRNQEKQKGAYATSGLYDQYIEEVTNVTSHGFHDYISQTNYNSVKFNPDLRADFEIGWNLKKHVEDGEGKWRMGFYAQYSLLDIADFSKNTKSLTELDLSRYLTIKMNNIYSSLSAVGGLHYATLGFKVSYLFPVAGKLYKNRITGRYMKRYKCMCERPTRIKR